MRAAIGSQCKLMNRGVTCILFGSLKINLAAAFWINCGLMELAGRPAKRANLQDRAVLAMWSEKFSLSSFTTPRFLAVFEGVMVDEPNWKVKL